jgi:hypothetical protein
VAVCLFRCRFAKQQNFFAHCPKANCNATSSCIGRSVFSKRTQLLQCSIVIFFIYRDSLGK